MISRRSMIGMTGAALACVACGPQNSQTITPLVAKRSIEKVGLQTYTLREAMAEDFAGTFRMIKDVGYDYVEVNRRNFEDMAANELKALLNDIGLPSPAGHISYSDVTDDISSAIQRAKVMQHDFVIVPYMDENQRSLADWKRHAQIFNQAGRKFADEGINLAYHNHQFEFDDLGGGTTAMEILMNETSPELVSYELDMFWAALANIDIPALMQRYPGRFKLCHIKDMSGDHNALIARKASYDEITSSIMVDVGKGNLPFEEYFAYNDIAGMEYFIAEHDKPKKPFRTAIENSLNGVKALSF